jgi:hypothetical protein
VWPTRAEVIFSNRSLHSFESDTFLVEDVPDAFGPLFTATGFKRCAFLRGSKFNASVDVYPFHGSYLDGRFDRTKFSRLIDKTAERMFNNLKRNHPNLDGKVSKFHEQGGPVNADAVAVGAAPVFMFSRRNGRQQVSKSLKRPSLGSGEPISVL